MKKINPEELLANGVHFGHKVARVHPKSRKYIHKIERGASIIDLYKTAELFDKALIKCAELAKENKTLLVVATKKQAKQFIMELSKTHNLPYLTTKWVGGFLTNFEEISKNIKKLVQFKKDKADGSLNELPKHEIVQLEKKMARIEKVYGGVLDLTALPGAIFIIDTKREYGAVDEGRMLGIPTIAIVDTNCDPDLVDYPIPANDDALTSISYIATKIIEEYSNNKVAPEEAKKK